MSKNKQDNKAIIEAIHFLNHGKPFKERKKHILEMKDGGVTEINGFGFQDELWCWVVWMPTDFGEHPEYKGEPLAKVVPKNITRDKDISKVLNAQCWMYI